MSRYPQNYYDDDWARIHKGHGLSRWQLYNDLNDEMGPLPDDSYMKVEELHLIERPRLKWCENYDVPCEFNGEWHTHWTGAMGRIAASDETKFTVVRWAKATVKGFSTLQFGPRGVDDYAVHLVRSTQRGTPGPTLCGIDRFAKNGPGWSVGGGVTGPRIIHTPCVGCAAAAVDNYPELPIGGLGAKEITETIGQLRRVAAASTT